MPARRTVLATTLALGMPALVRPQAASIRVGATDSCSAIPSVTLSYRNGWQITIDEIKPGGGVMGRKLEVIRRDEAGKPQSAIRITGELLGQRKVGIRASGCSLLSARPPDAVFVAEQWPAVGKIDAGAASA